MKCQILKCSKCGSENLVLDNPRPDGQQALICGDCGRWIKWCSKDERMRYKQKNQEKTKNNKITTQLKEISRLLSDVIKELEKYERS